jgi:hypothetical protein
MWIEDSEFVVTKPTCLTSTTASVESKNCNLPQLLPTNATATATTTTAMTTIVGPSMGPATIALATLEEVARSPNKKRSFKDSSSKHPCCHLEEDDTTRHHLPGKRKSMVTSTTITTTSTTTSPALSSCFNFDDAFRAICTVAEDDKRHGVFPVIDWCFDDDKHDVNKRKKEDLESPGEEVTKEIVG